METLAPRTYNFRAELFYFLAWKRSNGVDTLYAALSWERRNYRKRNSKLSSETIFLSWSSAMERLKFGKHVGGRTWTDWRAFEEQPCWQQGKEWDKGRRKLRGWNSGGWWRGREWKYGGRRTWKGSWLTRQQIWEAEASKNTSKHGEDEKHGHSRWCTENHAKKSAQAQNSAKGCLCKEEKSGMSYPKFVFWSSWLQKSCFQYIEDCLS